MAKGIGRQKTHIELVGVPMLQKIRKSEFYFNVFLDSLFQDGGFSFFLDGFIDDFLRGFVCAILFFWWLN